MADIETGCSKERAVSTSAEALPSEATSGEAKNDPVVASSAPEPDALRISRRVKESRQQRQEGRDMTAESLARLRRPRYRCGGRWLSDAQPHRGVPPRPARDFDEESPIVNGSTVA